MKAIKITLIVILSSVFVPIYGQKGVEAEQLDSLTMKFVRELQWANVDTICIYSDYYTGYVRLWEKDEPCTYSDSYFIPTYILWVSNGKTFLRKKDNCYDYKTIEIDARAIWDVFFKYRIEIQKEKVKPFEFKHGNKVSLRLTTANHIREFSIFTENKTIWMRFYRLDLEKEDGENKNMNYSHNQNLKGLILVDKLEELIRGIEDDNLLIKDGWVR